MEGEREKKKKKDRYLSTVTEESHVLSRFVASMQMHTRRSIVRDTLVLAFRKMDFTRRGRGGERPFEIYYIRGKREVNRERRDGAEIGGLQDNLCVANY